MSVKYLDDTGLSYFWGKIKSALSGKADLSSGKVVANQLTSSVVRAPTSPIVIDATYNGKTIVTNQDVNLVIQIPAGLPAEMEFEVVRYFQASVTFEAGEGVALRSIGGALSIADKFGVAVCKKLTSGDSSWLISGDLE